MTENTEVRITSKTGGQKGQKPARFDLLVTKFLWELALVCGFGAKKYDDDNWAKGYSWRLSYGALQRHLSLFWQREDNDAETGLHHLAHAGWHCMVLFVFSTVARYKQFDDRPDYAATPEDKRPSIHSDEASEFYKKKSVGQDALDDDNTPAEKDRVAALYKAGMNMITAQAVVEEMEHVKTVQRINEDLGKIHMSKEALVKTTQPTGEWKDVVKVVTKVNDDLQKQVDIATPPLTAWKDHKTVISRDYTLARINRAIAVRRSLVDAEFEAWAKSFTTRRQAEEKAINDAWEERLWGGPFDTKRVEDVKKG